jgi:spermidine synthase
MFDVLAACIAALAPGPRVVVLGFAGGGIVAPLRGMGYASAITAVDISRSGQSLFRELCGNWAGDVDVIEADAVAWLEHSRARFDLILEDLSVATARDTTKPVASLDTLPELMRRRLAPGGIAVTNVLPIPGAPWKRVLAHLAQPFAAAHVVHLHDYENRILVAGELPAARDVGRSLRAALGRIGSMQARRIAVRRLAV